MKLNNTLIIILTAIVCIFINACVGGNSNDVDNNAKNVGDITNAKNVGDITLQPTAKVTLLNHGSTNNYLSTTDNMNYIAYNISNNTAKPVLITSPISIVGKQPNVFTLITESNLYVKANNQVPCQLGTTLAPIGSSGSSCQILTTLTNPNQVYNESQTANIRLIVSGIPYYPALNLNSYAFVAGAFSQVYANQAQSIPAVASSGSGICGLGKNKACQIVALNLTNNNLISMTTSDFPVNSMTVGNGVIYAGGQLTSATYKSQVTVTEPAVGSMIVAINPASNTIADIQAGQATNLYASDSIWGLTYNQGSLYVAGGFTSLGGIVSTGYPIVAYNLSNNRWSNALGVSGDADAAISGLAINNNLLYASGEYSKMGGITYIESSFNNYVINTCDIGSNCKQVQATLYSPLVESSIYIPANSFSFDSQNTLYTAGGFSKINESGTGGNNYMIGALASGTDLTGSWNSLLNSGYPNAPVNTITTYGVKQYYTAGYFSSIADIAADSNSGVCGTGIFTDPVTATNSCLLARFNGTSWGRIFTTDGPINSIIFASQITGQ